MPSTAAVGVAWPLDSNILKSSTEPMTAASATPNANGSAPHTSVPRRITANRTAPTIFSEKPPASGVLRVRVRVPSTLYLHQFFDLLVHQLVDLFDVLVG